MCVCVCVCGFDDDEEKEEVNIRTAIMGNNITTRRTYSTLVVQYSSRTVDFVDRTKKNDQRMKGTTKLHDTTLHYTTRTTQWQELAWSTH